MTGTTNSISILGREISIPVRVRSARSWFASFVVPHSHAAAVISDSGLVPARMFRNRAMVSLAFVDYRDGDLDSYHEVAVAFMVADPEGGKGKAVYIHRLPVDQEFTCAAGRQIWGFPKFVTPIDIEEGDRSDRCVLTVDGAMALTMTIRRGVPTPMRDTALDAISVADGVMRRTAWEFGGSGSRMRPGGAHVELGSGEIADELRRLGFPKRALMSGCVREVHMAFQAAHVLGAAGEQ